MATIAKNKHQIVITSKRDNQTPRRTKYDMWSEILESCLKTHRTKYWLTSRLGMSWKVIDESIGFLTKAKLIEVIDSRNSTKKYQTTPKGQGALRTYKILINKYFDTTI